MSRARTLLRGLLVLRRCLRCWRMAACGAKQDALSAPGPSRSR